MRSCFALLVCLLAASVALDDMTLNDITQRGDEPNKCVVMEDPEDGSRKCFYRLPTEMKDRRPTYEVSPERTSQWCMDDLKRKDELLHEVHDFLAAMSRKRECRRNLSDWQRLKCRLGYSCGCEEVIPMEWATEIRRLHSSQ